MHRVLVVDDNKAAADLLSMVIKMTGNEVRTAGDGLRACEIAEDFLPDIILMDLGMPIMDGLEAARSIRKAPWGKNVKIIALTGWGQEEDKQLTREAGFDAHLVKPVEPETLQELLR
jgi:CheY-like chemotaxis protein